MAKAKRPGVDDNQTLILKCPVHRVDLKVTHVRTGTLDQPRGIHHVKEYGWYAVCPSCDKTWGDPKNLLDAPSMWALMDKVGS